MDHTNNFKKYFTLNFLYLDIKISKITLNIFRVTAYSIFLLLISQKIPLDYYKDINKNAIFYLVSFIISLPTILWHHDIHKKIIAIPVNIYKFYISILILNMTILLFQLLAMYVFFTIISLLLGFSNFNNNNIYDFIIIYFFITSLIITFKSGMILLDIIEKKTSFVNNNQIIIIFSLGFVLLNILTCSFIFLYPITLLDQGNLGGPIYRTFKDYIFIFQILTPIFISSLLIANGYLLKRVEIQ